MKDRWDKAQSLATIVSLLAVPTVLAWGGWRIQERIAEQSTKREYVQLALSILREVPNKDNADAKSLRTWAISIVDHNAPQPLTQENRAALYAVSLPSQSGATYLPAAGCSAGEIILGSSDLDCLQREIQSRDAIIRNLLLKDEDMRPQRGKDDQSNGKPR